MSPKPTPRDVTIRPVTPDDFDRIIEIGTTLYPEDTPWTEPLLANQRAVFPQGQIAAADPETDALVGWAATLIVSWEDYGLDHTWAEITGNGTFAGHDPTGRVLYAAEVMVDPKAQGRGIGKKLYAARRALARELGIKRIRAGARLIHYHKVAHEMTAQEYVDQIVAGERGDPTLSFQLGQGFKVIGVAPGYVRQDPQSLGNAAIIEWVDEEKAENAGSAENAENQEKEG